MFLNCICSECPRRNAEFAFNLKSTDKRNLVKASGDVLADIKPDTAPERALQQNTSNKCIANMFNSFMRAFRAINICKSSKAASDSVGLVEFEEIEPGSALNLESWKYDAKRNSVEPYVLACPPCKDSNGEIANLPDGLSVSDNTQPVVRLAKKPKVSLKRQPAFRRKNKQKSVTWADELVMAYPATKPKDAGQQVNLSLKAVICEAPSASATVTSGNRPVDDDHSAKKQSDDNSATFVDVKLAEEATENAANGLPSSKATDKPRFFWSIIKPLQVYSHCGCWFGW